MASKVCHIEYPTEDLAASQKFCEAIFGWEFRSFGDGMVVFGIAGDHIGGFSKGPRVTARACPEVSYAVSSVDSTIGQAQGLGAKVAAEKREVPGVGWYASIVAPDGNEFGLVEFTS